MGPRIHEVMTDRPRCVTPETSVSEAAKLMEADDVGSLPILDGEQLAGTARTEASSSEQSRRGKIRGVCRSVRLRAVNSSPSTRMMTLRRHSG